jgi:hypothetical protein
MAEVTVVNALIRRIRFVRRDGGPMPPFAAPRWQARAR